MTLHIKDAEADRLAHELAELTGIPVEEAVVRALRDQLAKERDLARRIESIHEVQRRFAALPVLDNRSDDEILGYDENGLPS